MVTARFIRDPATDIDAQHNNGLTALLLAARNGHTDCVQLLIAARANIDAQNNDGWTALMYATLNGHTDCARLLITASERLAELAEEPQQQHQAAATPMRRQAALPTTTANGTNDERICVVCMYRPRVTVFRPCGHHACCEDCAAELMGRGDPCPLGHEAIASFDVVEADQLNTAGNAATWRRVPLAAPPVATAVRLSAAAFSGLSAYSRLEMLGRGSFGVVYRGELDGEPVAIKTFHLRDFSAAADYAAEMAAYAGLAHPNVVRVLAYCEEECGIVFPLLTPLLTKLAAAPEMSDVDKLRVCADVATGLAYLHTQRRVHRDVKPGNVLVDARGTAILCDLGIARCIAPGRSHHSTHGAGTQLYMHLAVAASGEAKVEHDLYSLGVTVAAVFLGRDPLSQAELTSAVAGLSDSVKAVVTLCMLGGLTAVGAVHMLRPEQRPEQQPP
jgi:hypothetical protein